MKPIAEVYPDCWQDYGDDSDDRYWSAPSDYQPLLDSLGHEILLQVDDRDYQGDSRLLLRRGTEIGLLIFGWGSCSGCDALQACMSLEEVDQLRTKLAEDTKWFATPAEALNYLNTHDWEGDYCYHADELHTFLEQAKEILHAAQ